MPVRDFMSGTLVSARPETPLSDIQTIFAARDISAVPVLDDAGGLRGIVTSTDLLRVARVEMAEARQPERVIVPARTAADAMRTAVVTIGDDAEVREAARLMVRHRIHRVVVTRNGRAIGILSARDAMRAVFFERLVAPLSSVMSAPVETIDIGDPIRAAVDRLAEINVHGLVVVDGEWPVGVFTQAEAIKARGLSPEVLETPVERVMSYETVCLDVATPLFRAAGHALQMRVRRILVVEKRHLRGVVSGFDLVRVMT
jgi:CBS domain-containing protein